MCQGTRIPTYGGGGTQGQRHTGTPAYRDTQHRGHLGSELRQEQGSLPWGRADGGEREGCSSSRSQTRRSPGAGLGTDGRVRARVQVWGTGCRGGVRDPSTGSRCGRSFGSGSGCCSAPAAPAPEGSGSSVPPRHDPPIRGCRAPRWCRRGRKRLGKPGSGMLRGRGPLAPGKRGAGEQQSGLTAGPLRRRTATAAAAAVAATESRCRSRRLPARPRPSCRPPGAETRGGAGLATSSPPAPRPCPAGGGGPGPSVPGEGAVGPEAAHAFPSSSAPAVAPLPKDLTEGSRLISEPGATARLCFAAGLTSAWEAKYRAENPKSRPCTRAVVEKGKMSWLQLPVLEWKTNRQSTSGDAVSVWLGIEVHT